MWIRSPWWDGFWILSGLPLGAVLTGTVHLGAKPQLIILIAVLTFQTGHLLSPMVTAWAHRGYREIMLHRRWKFIAVPAGIALGCAAAAYIGGFFFPAPRFNPVNFSLSVGALREYASPLAAIAVIYAFWNAYHFGMQAFGVMSIYRRRREISETHDTILRFPDPVYGLRGHPGISNRKDERMPLSFASPAMASVCRPSLSQRRIDMLYCCFVTWAVMCVSFIVPVAHESYVITGWPAQPHEFMYQVECFYVAAGGLVVVAMLWREWLIGLSPPRALLVLTDGIGMVLAFQFGLWGFAIVAMNHWLVAIGLSSHVYSRHTRRSATIFALGLMVVGLFIFVALFVSFYPITLRFTATAVGLRLGLGFVHFLYDRWVYKFSDAKVRATIGSDIFCRETGRRFGV
jgi:hypothetical protein